ncbi:GTPase HflX [Bauldia litoralis]|uniref:GTPase HflX n=2 Tax=Bauldia litoralis TaxID=665467 RepID=UPI003D6632EB
MSETEDATDDHDLRRPPERTLVLVPIVRTKADAQGGRDSAARVEEAVGLAAAIDLDVIEGVAVPLASYRPGTLFGTGKVDEIAARLDAEKVGLVIVDHPLSPVQQRNLEKAWKAKVIDRTGLILEIFGERARTREGRLQVELAHLTYQKSRLVRSWTHLERQRGGFGFLGGPGETQIEADRRALSERIERIKVELASVATRRRLQRRTRKRSGQALAALVGYTNAGKSTLFNALTQSGVFADDRLFATLDPTLRRVELPNGTTIVLSDTVGFVSDLPTSLVAAFRGTLEEVAEADLILHVRDIADPDTEEQAKDVASVLGELDIDASDPDHVIEVWNKIDLIPPEQRPPARRAATKTGKPVGPTVIPVSALTGGGLETLLTAIEDHLAIDRPIYRVELTTDGLARLHRLYEMGEVLDREDSSDGTVTARVRVAEGALDRFRKAFPEARLVTKQPPAPEADAAA